MPCGSQSVCRQGRRDLQTLLTIAKISDLSAVDRVDELPAEATTEAEPQMVAA
jgi:hypothetical protein